MYWGLQLWSVPQHKMYWWTERWIAYFRLRQRSARLICPWDSPGENTGVGCHALLQGGLPNPGITPISCVSDIAGRFFTTEALEKPQIDGYWCKYNIYKANIGKCSLYNRYIGVHGITTFLTDNMFEKESCLAQAEVHFKSWKTEIIFLFAVLSREP